MPSGKCPRDATEEWACDSADLQADAAHCGACETRCAPTALYQQDQWHSDPNLVSDGARVFWMGQYDMASLGVFRASLAGGEPARLYRTGGNAFPRGMAVSSGGLYWVTAGWANSAPADSILRLPIDGGEVRVIVENQPSIHGFAVVGESIFLATNDGVMTVPIAGGASTVFAAMLRAGSIVADATNLYVTSFITAERLGIVLKLPLDGSAPVELARSASPGSFGPLVVSEDYLYFARNTEADGGFVSALERVPVAGGEVVTLAPAVHRPTSLAVDATHVYWAELGRESVVAGSVRKAPKAGGPVVVLATQQADPHGLTLVDANVVWVQTFYDFKLTMAAKEPCVSGVCSN